jgi:hypothetical protein
MLKHTERKTPGSANMPTTSFVSGRTSAQQPMAVAAIKKAANMNIFVGGRFIKSPRTLLVPGCTDKRAIRVTVSLILILAASGQRFDGVTSKHYLLVFD